MSYPNIFNHLKWIYFSRGFCEETKIILVLLIYFFHYSRPIQVIHPYSNKVESTMSYRFEIVIFYHSLLADRMILNDTRVSPFNREFPGPEAELQPTENDQKRRILD